LPQRKPACTGSLDSPLRGYFLLLASPKRAAKLFDKSRLGLHSWREATAYLRASHFGNVGQQALGSIIGNLRDAECWVPANAK